LLATRNHDEPLAAPKNPNGLWQLLRGYGGGKKGATSHNASYAKFFKFQKKAALLKLGGFFVFAVPAIT